MRQDGTREFRRQAVPAFPNPKGTSETWRVSGHLAKTRQESRECLSHVGAAAESLLFCAWLRKWPENSTSCVPTTHQDEADLSRDSGVWLPGLDPGSARLGLYELAHDLTSLCLSFLSCKMHVNPQQILEHKLPKSENGGRTHRNDWVTWATK